MTQVQRMTMIASWKFSLCLDRPTPFHDESRANNSAHEGLPRSRAFVCKDNHKTAVSSERLLAGDECSIHPVFVC